VVLKVNEEVVQDSAIRAEAERMRPSYEEAFSEMAPAAREEQLLDWSRENMIERALLRQEAHRRGGQIPQGDIDSAFERAMKQRANEGQADKLSERQQEDLKKEIELQLRIERLIEEVCEGVGEPAQGDIEQYYEQNKGRFKTVELVRAAHIVKYVNWLTDEKNAYEAICKAQDELRKGTLFEQLVAKYSDCPENGGDLGYISRGQMVEEFEDVAFNLSAGQTSDVFRTRFGFHIARVYDRKPATTKALDQVREEIVGELAEQSRRAVIDNFVDALKAEAKIEEL